MEYNAEDYDDYNLLPNGKIRLYPKDQSLPAVDVSYEQGKPIRDAIDAKRGSYVEVDSKDDGESSFWKKAYNKVSGFISKAWNNSSYPTPAPAGAVEDPSFATPLSPPTSSNTNQTSNQDSKVEQQPTSLVSRNDPENPLSKEDSGIVYAVIPGKVQLHSTSTQRVQGPGLTAKEKELLQGLADKRKDALTDLEAAEIEANKRRIEYFQKEQELYAERERKLIEQEAKLREQEQLAIDAKRKADEEAANYKIDPARFWKNKSGWTRALAAIGAFVSAAAAARSKTGRNYFMESMNKIIEDDIEAQKEELRALERKAKAKKDDVELTFLQNERERLSENILWQHRLGTLSAQLRTIEEETQNPIIRARAGLLRQDVDEALINRIIEAEREKRGTTTKTTVYQRSPDTVVAIGPDGRPMTKEEAEKTEKQVTEYSDKVRNIVALEYLINQLLEKRKQFRDDMPGIGIFDDMRPGYLSPEVALEVQKTREFVVSQLVKEMSGTGASEAERAHVEKLLTGAKSEKEFMAGLRTLARIVLVRRKAIDAGYPPIVRQVFKARGGYSGILETLLEEEKDEKGKKR